MKSLYAQYLEEKTDRKILESDHGFITYEIVGEECHIADIFTIREQRNSGVMKDLCRELTLVAKKAGCKVAIGQVLTEYKNATEGLEFCLKMGMRLLKASDGVVYLIKEI